MQICLPGLIWLYLRDFKWNSNKIFGMHAIINGKHTKTLSEKAKTTYWGVYIKLCRFTKQLQKNNPVSYTLFFPWVPLKNKCSYLYINQYCECDYIYWMDLTNADWVYFSTLKTRMTVLVAAASGSFGIIRSSKGRIYYIHIWNTLPENKYLKTILNWSGGKFLIS